MKRAYEELEPLGAIGKVELQNTDPELSQLSGVGAWPQLRSMPPETIRTANNSLSQAINPTYQ